MTSPSPMDAVGVGELPGVSVGSADGEGCADGLLGAGTGSAGATDMRVLIDYSLSVLTGTAVSR